MTLPLSKKAKVSNDWPPAHRRIGTTFKSTFFSTFFSAWAVIRSNMACSVICGVFFSTVLRGRLSVVLVRVLLVVAVLILNVDP